MFKVFSLRNNKEKELVVNYLNKSARLIYDAEKKSALEDLENDTQRAIYLDWWNGEYLWKWNEEAKSHDRNEKYKGVSDYNWEKAHDRILTTVSRGMG